MSKRDLHIICGKCGAYKDELTFSISSQPDDEIEDQINFSCSIHCKNCGTLTGLSEVLEEEE